MVEFNCLPCRIGWTDLRAEGMPPPGRTVCPHCQSKHVMISMVRPGKSAAHRRQSTVAVNRYAPRAAVSLLPPSRF